MVSILSKPQGWRLTLVTFGVMLWGLIRELVQTGKNFWELTPQTVSQKPQFAATSYCLSAVMNIQLAKNMIEVAFHRPQADKQLVSDGLVR